MRYVGRFAPSPTGPLHAGSLVAALASWLDARAHHGRWLVRIEDVDTPRTVKGADQHILHQLAACGLVTNEPVEWQSKRFPHYQSALTQLDAKGLIYGCCCSRQAILHALELNQQPHRRHTTPRYPGTCERLDLNQSHPNLAQRLKTRPAGTVTWTDRASGHQTEPVHAAVGDFVLKRADGIWAYQLAVVVDDAAQGVTHVVRGADLADNTARQIYIQHCLDLAQPHYLHTPLVMGPDGQKLSKQNNATAVPLTDTLGALRKAAAQLNLPADVMPEARQPSELLQAWILPWRSVWMTAFTPPSRTYN